MKDYKCAHCAHCNEIKYDGFFCDKTGYLEHKRIEDKCNDFEADEFTAVQYGHWIPIEYDSFADGSPIWDKWECSECGHEHNGEKDTLSSFCPDCGADMRKGCKDNA